jgi:hypothetical protein
VKGEAPELARELDLRIRSLVQDLLPGGELRGSWWRCGSLAGERGNSLAVTLKGPRQGRWRDYAADEGGDALDLVAQIKCNGDKREAMDWARQWLGRPEREREPKPRPPDQRPGKVIGEDLLTQSRKWAMKIWLGAQPVQRGDLVWRYLGDRGIDLGRLPRVPSVLRFHPGLWNRETQRAWPAMVAMVGDAEGKNVAVHRTWLAERNLAFEDRAMVSKAPLVEQKLTLGSFRGGYIRLWRGLEGRPWSSVKPGETLLLSEGIEDLLSYLQFEPQWRAACAVSLSFMVAMDLPPEFTELRILGQRDPRMTPDGKTVRLSPARRLLNKVIHRFEGKGRKVFLWTPPVYAKDINEYIQQRRVMAEGVSNVRRRAG